MSIGVVKEGSLGLMAFAAKPTAVTDKGTGSQQRATASKRSESIHKWS